MRQAIVALALLILSVPRAVSQEKLVPAPSAFDVVTHSYYQSLRKVLLERNEEGNLPFDLRYWVLPSFEREYFLGIRLKDGIYEATYRIPEREIWEARREMPVDSIGIIEVKCRLSPELGRQLQKVIPPEVYGAEFPKPTGKLTKGCDGTTYYFSVWQWDTGVRTATIWSPYEGRTKELVGLMDEVVGLVAAGHKTVGLTPGLNARLSRLLRSRE